MTWTWFLLWTVSARAAPTDEPRPTWDSLVVDEVWRGGFHFQILFGIGGGVDTEGVHHAMELGGTFRNGVTLGLLHTFVQNRGILRDKGGPDLVGGWLLETKVPFGRPEVVGKLALGPGGLHDQSDGIRAIWGLAIAYGVDLHLPVTRRSGPTLGLTFVNAFVPDHGHFWTASVGLGYTVF